jgi:putative sugar O-methyltransferase
MVMLKRAVPDLHVQTVLEIGGGYGTLGEILLQQNPGLRYVDVDIPPVAAVATWYLAQVLGEDRILAYTQTRDLEKIELANITESATVLCSWQLPRVVGTVDLFVNFISFQEMEPAVVANYAEHVSRLGARYLLLRNSPVGKPGVRERTLRSTYLDVFSDYELVEANSSLYGQSYEGESEVMVLVRR